MLSGNGRHRRPRQAPALVVAAGVTGSAIAIPLLGAGSASAVESTTWDRVAECESGGAWSADTGNGYYGGLQISQETWEAFGGTKYASRADLASRQHQILVAEKVLAAQGAKAWAACAEMAGLTGTDSGAAGNAGGEAGNGKSDENGKAPASDASEAPGEKAGRSQDTASSGKAEQPGKADKADKAEKSANPTPRQTQGVGNGADSGAGDATGSGRHRGEPANEPANGADGTSAPEGSSNEAEAPDKADAANGAGTPKGDAGDTGAADGADASDRAAPSAEGREAEADRPSRGDDRPGAPEADLSAASYTVRPGDSLSAIAKAQELDGGWNALYEKNRETVGGDPDLIHPGQSLDLASKQG